MEEAYEFGRNWKAYSRVINDQRVQECRDAKTGELGLFGSGNALFLFQKAT